MIEINVDTLVGPTHAHGGLAYGNIASLKSRHKPSNPKLAALEGLEKMKLLFDLGIPQLIFPPHPRPLVKTLESMGLSLDTAYTRNPKLFFQCSSSSAMWTANAATVSPSADTEDKKVHITIANLAANFHRSLEAPFTLALFKKAFFDKRYFTIHEPLPSAYELFDEGAANHTRFTNGIELFVYGRASDSKAAPTQYPARQTREASECVARRHKLNPEQAVFAQQNPAVIDKGVFHNDVIATGHETLYILHEESYLNHKKLVSQLRGIELVCITNKELSIDEAVSSYLFNSQIVTSHGKRIMICPEEVYKSERAKKVAESLPGIDEIRYIRINQSMKNGGGPACLRLRMQLTQKELASVYNGVIFTETVYEAIKTSILKYYPEQFTLADLLDPTYRKQIAKAFKNIYEILQCSDLFPN